MSFFMPGAAAAAASMAATTNNRPFYFVGPSTQPTFYAVCAPNGQVMYCAVPPHTAIPPFAPMMQSAGVPLYTSTPLPPRDVGECSPILPPPGQPVPGGFHPSPSMLEDCSAMDDQKPTSMGNGAAQEPSSNGQAAAHVPKPTSSSSHVESTTMIASQAVPIVTMPSYTSASTAALSTMPPPRHFAQPQQQSVRRFKRTNLEATQQWDNQRDCNRQHKRHGGRDAEASMNSDSGVNTSTPLSRDRPASSELQTTAGGHRNSSHRHGQQQSAPISIKSSWHHHRQDAVNPPPTGYYYSRSMAGPSVVSAASTIDMGRTSTFSASFAPARHYSAGAGDNNPLYKTRICRQYLEGGFGECPYQNRCHFLHPSDADFDEALQRETGNYYHHQSGAPQSYNNSHTPRQQGRVVYRQRASDAAGFNQPPMQQQQKFHQQQQQQFYEQHQSQRYYRQQRNSYGSSSSQSRPQQRNQWEANQRSLGGSFFNRTGGTYSPPPITSNSNSTSSISTTSTISARRPSLDGHFTRLVLNHQNMKMMSEVAAKMRIIEADDSVMISPASHAPHANLTNTAAKEC